MEKVVAAIGENNITNYDLREVNDYLREGWTVKSVTMHHTKDRVTAIFVLEKF